MADRFDLRRVVTGQDENGRSIVIVDGPPGRLQGNLQEIWNTDSSTVDDDDHRDRGAGPQNLSPVENGTNFRWFVVPPTDTAIPQEELEERIAAAFEALGASHERPDTSRHPAMHRTKTIDYVVVLSGNVTLMLDDDERDLREFDVVVQRATNHAWINRGKKPALLCAILIDAKTAT